MQIDVLQWVVSQGIGATLAFAMFMYYRKDAIEAHKKLSETAKAYMEFGERYSHSLTLVADALHNLTKIQERIEYHLNHVAICPVTQLTYEELKKRYESEVEDGNRKPIKTIVESMKEHLRDGN